MTLHPRLSGNAIAWGGAPVVPALGELAAAGFASCGLTVSQLAAAEPSAPQLAALEPGAETPARGETNASTAPGPLPAALERTGLRVTHVCVPAPFSLARPAAWEEETALAVAALERAAAVGTERAVLTTGPPGALGFEPVAEAFTAAVAPLRKRAERLGVRLLVEPSNQLRDDLGFVSTLRDALAVAEASGIGVCLDLLWCWRERGLRQTLSGGTELIDLVQVSDCRTGQTSMPCRVVPGDGAIPLEPLLAAILESGYEGPFDLELLGPEIDAEGAARALRRGGELLSATLHRLGA